MCASRSAACGRAGSRNREPERGHIGEHVTGIGEERKRVSEHAPNHLDDQERRGDGENPCESPAHLSSPGHHVRAVPMNVVLTTASVVVLAWDDRHREGGGWGRENTGSGPGTGKIESL